MGLENLKSVFSKIYKNTLPEKGYFRETDVNNEKFFLIIASFYF